MTASIMWLVGFDEIEYNSFGSKSSCSSYSVQIDDSILGKVVVDNKINCVYINSTSEEVGCYKNSKIVLFEFIIVS